MPMYNLSKYNENYRKITGSSWNYYRDKSNNPSNDNYNTDLITNSASFKYKSNITGKTLDNDDDNDDNDNRKKIKNKAKQQSCCNCCAIKIFKQFLENFRYVID